MAIGRPSFVVKGGQTAQLAEVLEGHFEPGGQCADDGVGHLFFKADAVAFG